MITMASFLEDYKNGVGGAIALNNFLISNPKHTLALAINEIKNTLDDKKTFVETIAFLNNFDYREFEVEEQLLYLFNLFLLYINFNRISSANSTYSIMKSITSTNLPPEWQIIHLQAKCELLAYAGNRKQRALEIEKCLKIIPQKSGRYNIVYFVYIIELCDATNYEKLEEHQKIFTLVNNEKRFLWRPKFTMLIKLSDQGYFEKIKPILDNIIDDIPKNMLGKSIFFLEKLFQVFIKNNYSVLDEKNIYDGDLLSCVSLIRNEPVKALFWAKKGVESHTYYKNDSTFKSYCLLRAELANGNVNTAKYFLTYKQRLGSSSLFDDFFWFRIFHIKGDKIKAQFYYDLFANSADKFDLHKRFDIELKLSPEISLTDLRFYAEKRTIDIKLISPKFSSGQNIKYPDDAICSIIGDSPIINHVKDLVNKYAKVESVVLIVGETGTGKELIAKALWQASPFNTQPFLPINCGAISDHLLQSELFGHKKGAFTGAFQDHKGILEEAKGGIVFLDEIGEISNQMQISLLRVLESGEYRSVGGVINKKINCKIIAATNRNLTEHVNSGHFRKDLQYRLERLVIEVPALRTRITDLPALINHFLNTLNTHLPPINFDKISLQQLATFPWEGNIRELRNEMERVRLFHSDKKTLTIAELSEKYRMMAATLKVQPFKSSNELLKSPLNLKSKFRRLEELKVLFQTNKTLSRTEVATYLKVSPNTAANYLSTLEKENFISAVKDGTLKSNYYEKN
jgi:DNA-binding NtrC family response regulator